MSKYLLLSNYKALHNNGLNKIYRRLTIMKKKLQTQVHDLFSSKDIKQLFIQKQKTPKHARRLTLH